MPEETTRSPGPRDDEATFRTSERRSQGWVGGALAGQRMIALAIKAFAGAAMAHVEEFPGGLVFGLAALAFAIEYLVSYWSRG